MVTPATPTVTWADPASIVSGAPLSSARLDATADVPGTVTDSPAAGTVPGAGNNQALSVAFAPTDSTDSKGASATATLNVLPAAATATATYIRRAAMTQGNWMGAYGGQGSDVIDGSSSLPSYASVTPSGQSNYVWASSVRPAVAISGGIG